MKNALSGKGGHCLEQVEVEHSLFLQNLDVTQILLWGLALGIWGSLPLGSFYSEGDHLGHHGANLTVEHDPFIKR